MRRTVGLLLATITIAACSGSDAAPAPLETPPPVTPTPTVETSDPVDSTEPTVTEPEITTTEATTTTIDEAAILAAAEAAYLAAYEVGRDALRNPDDPENEARIRRVFTGPNLDLALADLQLTIDGEFIAKENPDNPSFATTFDDAEFVDGDQTLVRITVCEFYSDELYERGAAPDGSDTLIRDNPVTLIFVTRVAFVDETWRAESGGEGEEVRDEEERCSSAS